MQDFYKGQEFYYIDTRTHKKVYLTLLGVKDDVLYVKNEKGDKYAIKKHYINKTIFVSLFKPKPKPKPKSKSKNQKPIDSRPMYSNGNLDENLGNVTTKRPAKRFDGPAPGTEDIVLPNYRGSKYAGTHRSGSGRINKRKKRR